MNIDTYLLPHTKLNFNYIKSLNITLTTLSLIQEKVGNMSELIHIVKDFFEKDPNSTDLKTAIDR